MQVLSIVITLGNNYMKWHAPSELNKSRYYEIEQDPLVGFYLYVFEDGKCIYDDLQDTLEFAMECAWKDYGVRRETWELVVE